MKRWIPGKVRLACDELRECVRGKKIALMMNTSAIANDGRLLPDVMIEEKWAEVAFFFGMEHGVRGNLYAGDSNVGDIDEKTGIGIVNLYNYPGLIPPLEYVQQVDAVVFCAQDVGIRHWTYTPWMMKLIDTAAQAGREVIILDRPNPIRGDIVEGECAKKYVGRGLLSGFEYPLRHGMTIGELALMYNDVKNVGADITVLKMDGWTRDMWYDETGLIWLPPSPNMPTVDTPLYFGATGLMQSSNFSLGIGTATPFQYIGGEYFDGDRMADELNARGLDGVYFVPKFYMSVTGDHTTNEQSRPTKLCSGVMTVIADRLRWRPVTTQLHIIDALIKLYPDIINFERRSARIRMCTDEVCDLALARQSVLPLVDVWAKSSEEFMRRREEYLLY